MTQNYQFTFRLTLDAENVELFSEAKLLGTIIQSDMKWNSNTSNIVRRANARMILLRKLAEFGATEEDLKIIYISYIRSILEQSAVVWHTSLTESNREDLERVQKTASKIILKNKYITYMKSLEDLSLDTLEIRRNKLCTDFAIKSINQSTIRFEYNEKSHKMTTRHSELIKVKRLPHRKTEKLLHSTISKNVKFSKNRPLANSFIQSRCQFMYVSLCPLFM